MGKNQRMSKTYTFPASHRLHSRAQVSAVFAAKVSKLRGPLVMYAIPNNLPHPRLALVISRRAGTAVVRNRIKRRLREAFRLHQHDLPAGYDMVIVVRPHEPMALTKYESLLSELKRKLHDTWQCRRSEPKA